MINTAIIIVPLLPNILLAAVVASLADDEIAMSC